MRLVRWSAQAKKSLADIFDHYLYDERPDAAHRLIGRIVEGGDALGRHATGRPSGLPGIYIKSLTEIDYLLPYRIDKRGASETIYVLDIIRTRRNWTPGDLPPKSSPP